VTPVVTFENARPVGFVVDDAGAVIAIRGEHGNTSDEVAAFSHDGSSVTSLVEPPTGSVSSLAADASHVYYVSKETSLTRVPRAGGKAETVAATSTTCRITAVAIDDDGLYVATTRSKSPLHEIWLVKK
jgi:hypothetical protein